MDTCKQPNAGEVVSGLEQVVLDDNIHPFVANIKMAESHMKLFTVEIKHKNKKQNIIISDRRTISFSKIVSIQQIKNTCKKYRKEDMKTLKFELSDAHFTRIFLRERKMEEVKGQSSGPDAASDVTSCLDLITCGFSRLHVQLVSLWHAQRLRASLCIDDQYGHTAVDLAEDYYRETVTSLREVGKQKSPLADQVEILHEFADEVVSDIELKTICFQDKELFIMLFKLYDSVLAAPDHKMVHMKNKALMMTNLSTKNKTDVEIEETIFKRLLLFHAIIRVRQRCICQHIYLILFMCTYTFLSILTLTFSSILYKCSGDARNPCVVPEHRDSLRRFLLGGGTTLRLDLLGRLVVGRCARGAMSHAGIQVREPQ